jgi:tape measure domain-containing protein
MANKIVQAVYGLTDQVTAKLKSISDAWRSHKTTTDSVASGIEKNNARASASYKKTTDDVGKLKVALGALAAFVGLQKVADGLKAIVDTGERFDDLEKKFATAFGSLEKGQEQLAKVREFAKTVPQPFEDIAAAAIKLRQFGFDPLDGTLQALIDNQNAVDQSQEDLLATIEALGKAYVKGGVNVKALVALTEQGVPVFDLLGKAMGVSADRVRELAESGQLGQDSIKQLVAELGKLRAGAAADELGDTDAQLAKLKDSAQEFLDTIAHSGALDVFRDELKNLNEQVNAAAKDGRLKELAKSISDGIVSTASAIKSGVGFVVQYAGELKELAKAYLLFRGLSFAADVYKSSRALIDAARAASVAKTAAEGAAGGFGKLSAAARRLQTNIKIGIVTVGADIALSSIQQIMAALREESEVIDGTNEQIDKNAAALKRLREATRQQKDEAKGFADTLILSREALTSQTEEQLQSYQRALQGAQRYYAALAVEAEKAGKTAAMDDANTHLALLARAVADVNEQLKVTSAVGKEAATNLGAGASAIAARLGEVKGDAKALKDEVEKIFEGFDLTKPSKAVSDFALGFDAVAAKGGKAAETLHTTLLAELKNLSGKDLLAFQTNATAAMQVVGDGGEKTSAILKASLEVELERLGVKAEDTGAKITKSGADTIATFKAVATNAQANAQTIVAAFDAALAGAKTKDEAEALGKAIEEAATRGVVSTKQLAEAHRELDERIRTVTASVSPLANQFELLGIKSQRQLIATRDNAREAFQAVVDGAREGVAAQEDVVRAFKAYADAARAAAADSDAETKARVEQQLALQASSTGLRDVLEQLGVIGKDAGEKTAEAFQGAKDTIDSTADAARRAGDAARDAADGQDTYTTALTNTRDAATGVVAVTGDMHAALGTLTELLSRDANLTTISLQQAQDLLQRLGPLAGDAAQLLTQRISDLEEAARRAEETSQRMKEEADSLQDQIDQLQGNDESIEDRRHAKKLADLKAEAEANGTANTAEHRHLVELENQLHDLKLRNVQKQRDEARANASKQREDSSAGDTSTINVKIPSTKLTVDGQDVTQLSAAQVRALAQRMGKDPVAAEAILKGAIEALKRAKMATGIV